jgi:hypothetical protein
MVENLTLTSLQLEFFYQGAEKAISTGTGFLLKAKDKLYLITNWHNVTGRNSETLDYLCGYGQPDFVRVWFHSSQEASWEGVDIYLRNDDGINCFIEHETKNGVDVVAIPIQKKSGIKYHFISYELSETLVDLYPSKAVSIIGYPNNQTSGAKFPIWKKGHIASEPEYNYDGKPIFLIDATTRSGMSGSPVVIMEPNYLRMGYADFSIGMKRKLLGVYSGRIDENSEIGRVWKPIVLKEMLGL